MQFDAGDVNNRSSSLLYWVVKKLDAKSTFFEQFFFYIYLKKYTIISILKIVKYQDRENIESREVIKVLYLKYFKEIKKIEIF